MRTANVLATSSKKKRIWLTLITATLLLVGLVAGSFVVFGSYDRTAGARHLRDAGFNCQREEEGLIQSAYFQYECAWRDNSNENEESDIPPEDEYYKETGNCLVSNLFSPAGAGGNQNPPDDNPGPIDDNPDPIEDEQNPPDDIPDPIEDEQNLPDDSQETSEDDQEPVCDEDSYEEETFDEESLGVYRWVMTGLDDNETEDDLLSLTHFASRMTLRADTLDEGEDLSWDNVIFDVDFLFGAFNTAERDFNWLVQDGEEDLEYTLIESGESCGSGAEVIASASVRLEELTLGESGSISAAGGGWIPDHYSFLQATINLLPEGYDIYGDLDLDSVKYCIPVNYSLGGTELAWQLDTTVLPMERFESQFLDRINQSEDDELVSKASSTADEAEDAPTTVLNFESPFVLSVKTFKDESAKEAFFIANLDEHPCRLVSPEHPYQVIEGDLFIVYPKDETLHESTHDNIAAVYGALVPDDGEELVIYNSSTGCSEVMDDLTRRSLACQQSESTTGECSGGVDTALIDTINTVAARCQAMYDKVEGDNPPSNEDLADCLDIKPVIRQDFIDSTRAISPDDALVPGGYYTGGDEAYTVWYQAPDLYLLGDARGRYQFELVALHEYLHKLYFTDLTLRQRMGFNMEIMRLADSDDELLIDHVGQDILSVETRGKIGRHNTFGFTSNLSDFLDMVDTTYLQLEAILPDDIKHEYADFLDDRYGRAAFVLALGETAWSQVLTRGDSNISSSFLSDKLVLPQPVIDDFEEILENFIAATNTLQTSTTSVNELAALHFADDIILPATATEDDSDEEDEVPQTEDDGDSPDLSPNLFITYSKMRGGLAEGYPILALESTLPLSDWLEEHFNQYFDRASLTAYFEYHPALEFEPPAPLEHDLRNRRRQNDIAYLQTIISIHTSNNNAQLPNRSEMQAIINDSDWYYYQPGTFIDSTSASGAAGFSYTAFPDVALVNHFLPNPEQVHIFTGASCGQQMMTNNANIAGATSTNKYVEGDLETANTRFFSIVYATEGDLKPACVDNF